MKKLLKLRVNGLEHELAARPHQTLLDALRTELGLTGTKQGCGEGDCGACAVLLDGTPVNSCLVLALEAEGRDVSTIEGVADGNALHPLQQAFVDHGAVQCGFCTPGMVMVSKAALEKQPQVTRVQARQIISGNLCRCTGYQYIVEAIVDAGERMTEGHNGPCVEQAPAEPEGGAR